jgi:undecaprenyl-diphosphatase
LRLVGFSFLITSALLLATKFFKNKSNKDSKTMKWFDALVIGLFQALAILPGVSRSGATLSGGIFRKIDRARIFQFSFFLAIPAIIGAVVLQIPEIIKSQFNLLNQSILGMLIAGFVGYFSLNFLKKVLINSQLWFFGIYCFLIGFLLLFF